MYPKDTKSAAVQLTMTLEGLTAPGDPKSRGGYYTPAPIVDALTRWAVQSGDRVLEPSAGDGAFVGTALKAAGRGGRITAIEQDEVEAAKLRSGAPRATVVAGDACTWFQETRPDGHFDSVVGNPPFIRYQNFPEPHRQAGFDLMRDVGMQPNRLTNAWVPFVVLGTRALREGGRLAMVVPAELMQVSYAAELREFLVRNYSQLTVVSFRRLVFDGIQQETLLVLGKRADASRARMRFLELDSAVDVAKIQSRQRGTPADLDHAREKWTQYYLTDSELSLVREIESSNAVTTLGALAEVDVGIVTGRNEFFVLTPQDARGLGLTKSCLPLVGRSAQIPGLVLRDSDFDALHSTESKCLLLSLGDVDRAKLSKAARAYVESAEARGLHAGYKTRIRLPNWWKVPSKWAPDAFLLRQIHEGPRIVANHAGAYCTDTLHRLRCVDERVSPDWLASASMNSLTWAFSEIRGRSYGGGVLELEPTEAEGLPFPAPRDSLPLDDLDLWVRHKETEQVLDEVDRLVLKPAGFARSEIAALRGIWRKLSSRRADRKRR